MGPTGDQRQGGGCIAPGWEGKRPEASKESNAGAANAAGGAAPAENFHPRLISAAEGRGRRRRRLSCESNFTGQKRQQQREPISRLTKGEGAGSGAAGLSKNRLRWGMEGEDASGQQTPADFLLTEGGEGAAPRSTPCQRYGSRLLSLKDWQRAWAKGKKIIAKRRFKKSIRKKQVAAAGCYSQGPSAPPGARARWGCAEAVRHIRCLSSRSQRWRLGWARGGCRAARGARGACAALGRNHSCLCRGCKD